MIDVIMNWICIGIQSFGLGFGFIQCVKRKTGYEVKQIDSILLVGMIIETVYAQIYSLFAGVSMLAFIILLIVSVMLLFGYRKELAEWGRHWHHKRQRKAKWRNALELGMGIVIILWMAYFTSRGYIHYDTDLYHAQSIRWIEEYGVVPGLGNLHFRFAYNSSLFALSALFSMKWMFGQSLHAVNGFFGLLLAMEISRIRRILPSKRVRIADFARAAAFYYLVLAVDEMTSPASDYAIMFILFYLVIKWLTLLETEEGYVPYALLCVAGAYAVTLKLTAGLILLLVIKPIKEIWKQNQIKERWKKIGMYAFLGILIVAPWMIRTAIISGYLLYPFPELDVLSVPYKIPVDEVIYDACEIKVWGRGLYDVSLINTSIMQWIPNWFSNTLTSMEKVIILADLLVLTGYVIYRIRGFIQKQNGQKSLKKYDLPMVAVSLSYLFWQGSAPLMRYGYAYCLLVIALGIGMILEAGWQKRGFVWLQGFVMLLLAMVFLWKGSVLIKDTLQFGNQPYYFKQKDYGSYELSSYQIGTETIYIPVEGDQVGYSFFPAIPYEKHVGLRGERLKDGFLPED